MDMHELKQAVIDIANNPMIYSDECGDKIVRLCFEAAAEVADTEAIRLRNERMSVFFMHGALHAATAIRDKLNHG